MRRSFQSLGLLFLASALGACATTQQGAQNISPLVMHDAVNVLQTRFKPAKTQIQVQPAHSESSQAFVHTLRKTGYAVVESKKPDGHPNLLWVFEPVGNTSIYRMSMAIAGLQFSRAYQAPAWTATGPWLVQEG